MCEYSLSILFSIYDPLTNIICRLQFNFALMMISLFDSIENTVEKAQCFQKPSVSGSIKSGIVCQRVERPSGENLNSVFTFQDIV